MAQQTRRSPGRPKKVQAEDIQTAVAEAPKPKKRTVIKRKENLNTVVEYEIQRGGGVAYMLPQKGVTVFDEDNNTVREMRYCPNEPSIYVDEQSDNAIKESVIFREGRIFVPKNKPNLKKFLDNHPFNVQNGGTIFKLVDKKGDAEAELAKEFKASEAIGMVRDKDINELLPIALYFKVNINTPTSEIRYNLLNVAKKNPQEFIEAFDSPQVQARSIIQQAKDYQIIDLKEDRCFWFDSGTMIVSVPAGQNPMDVMVRYCLTEKGAPVLGELEQRLEKLA
jgi:hypothetical protein